MTAPQIGRRHALALIAGSGAVLVGCGNATEAQQSSLDLPPVAPLSTTSELLAIRRLYLLEQLQASRTRALATTSSAAAGARRDPLLAEAAIEDQHVEAVRGLIVSLGGRPDRWTPTPPPARREAALRELRLIDAVAAGSWRWGAEHFAAFETRTAALSLLGVEIRQVQLLDGLLGRRASLEAPAPVSPAAIGHRLGAALGPVPVG